MASSLGRRPCHAPDAPSAAATATAVACPAAALPSGLPGAAARAAARLGEGSGLRLAMGNTWFGLFFAPFWLVFTCLALI